MRRQVQDAESHLLQGHLRRLIQQSRPETLQVCGVALQGDCARLTQMETDRSRLPIAQHVYGTT